MVRVIDLECNLPPSETADSRSASEESQVRGSGDTFRGREPETVPGYGMANYGRIFESRGEGENTVRPISIDQFAEVVARAGLSFLGVGIKPPAATWGIVIQEGFPDIRTNVWASIAPGVAITSFVLAVNLLGDRLRDVLDPHLRGSR